MEIQNKYSEGSKQSGASVIEFLVSLTFFVPLFITIPIIGKYIDLKQKTVEASRYAAWERSVWSDVNARWNDNENTKTDAQIRREVDARLFGHPVHGMHNQAQTENPLWRDRKSQNMLKSVSTANNQQQRVSVAVGESESPVSNLLVDELSYKGIPVLKNLSQFTSAVNRTIGKLVPDCKNLPGVDFDKGMNLGAKTYADIQLNAVANNFTSGTDDLNFASGSTLLSNAWAAPTESIYRERVGKLVLDESVKCISAPGSRIIGLLPPYKEGKAAANISGSAASTVLLKEYKK